MSGSSSDGPENDILKLGIDASGVDAGAKKAEASLEVLKDAATEAASALDKVAPAATKTGAAVDKVAPSVAKTSTALDGLEAAATGAASGLGKVAPAAAGAGAGAAKAGAEAQASAAAFAAWEKALGGIGAPAAKAQTEAEKLAAQFQATGVASTAGAQKMAQMHLQMEEARRKAIALGQGFYDLRAGPNGLERIDVSATKVSGGLRDLGAGLQGVSGSVRLTSRELQMLAPQINDIFTQLSMGQGVMMTLMAQGPQIVQGFGGVGATFTRVTEVVGTARLAMLGFVAVGGAAILAHNSHEGALASLSNRLRSVTTDFNSAAREIEASSRILARSITGLSRSDAADAQVAIRGAASRVGGLGAIDMRALVTDVQDFSRTIATDFAGAMTLMTRLMREPTAVVTELSEKGFPGLDRAFLGTVEALQRGGSQAEAFNLALGRIRQQTRDAREAMSPLERAWDDFGKAMGRFWDTIGPTVLSVGAALLDWITRFASGVGQVVSLIDRLRNMPAIDAGPVRLDEVGTAYEGLTGSNRGFREALLRAESGGNPTIPIDRNPIRALGGYQFMAETLQGLGLYRPAEGEVTRLDGRNVNQWRGTFSIPGFESVRTAEDFRMNPAAQNVAFERYLARIDASIDRLGVLGTNTEIGGVRANRDGLRAVAWLAGEGGMARFVQSGGAYNPGDGGTTAMDRYRAFSVTADRVAVTGDQVTTPAAPGGASALTPAAQQAADADRDRNRALGIARGDISVQSPTLGRDTNLANLRAAVELMRQQRALTTDPLQRDVLTAGIERLSAAAEQSRDPIERYIEGVRRTAAVAAEAGEPQQRLTERMQAFDEQMRNQGVEVSFAQRMRVMAAEVESLNLAFGAVSREADRQIESTQRLITAYGQGDEAVARATARERAIAEVRRAGVLGAEQQAAAVDTLTEKYTRLNELEVDRQSQNSQREAERQIELIQAEANMAGMLADQRERELAALRERQRIQRSGGDVNSDASQGAINTARQLADVRRQAEQTQNSWRAMEQAGVGAFETIGNAITQALATGEIRTIRLGDIWRAVMAQMIQATLRLAVINPILNSFTGGNLGTLGGLMGGGGAAGGAMGAGAAGGGLMGSLGSLGSLSSIGNALNSGWSTVSGWFGGGAAAGGSAITIANSGLGVGALDGAGGLAALEASGVGGANAAAGAGLGGLGGAFGGLALGYGAGSMVGGWLAGNSAARQQNAQLGAAGGAALGIGLAALGLGPLGFVGAGLLGGVLGGAGGGLIGPGPKTNAFGFSVDAKDGTFKADRLQMTGNGNGGQQAFAEAQAALERINAVMKEFGVTVRDGNRVVNGQTDSEDQSKTLDGTAKVFRFQAEDQRINTAIADKSFDSFDAFANTLQQAKTLADALDAAADKTSEFQRGVNELAKTYDKQISVAQALGFGEAELKAEREKQITELFAARDKELAGARRSFEVMRLSAEGRTQEAAAIEQTFARSEAIDAMRKRMEALGLAAGDVAAYVAAYTDALLAQAAAADKALAEQRRALGANLDIRYATQAAAVSGSAQAQLDASLQAAAEQARVETASLTAQLTALGFSADKIAQKTAQLAQVHELEAQALQQQIDARKTAIAQGLDDRLFAATVDTSTQEGALAAYDRQAARERVAAAREGLADMVQLERVQAAERLRIIEQFSEQANAAVRQLGGGIRGFIDQLQATPSGGLGIPEQFTNAQAQFARDLELGRGGNQEALGRISGTASTLLNAGQAMYASGPQFQALRAMILSSLEGLPAVQSYDALILAELQKLGGSIEVQVVADLTTTLRTLVEGSASLTADQRTILLANTETVQRTLNLLVTGQVGGLTPAQRDIAQATGGEITSTLTLLVKGQTAGMTAPQRELAFATTNIAIRTLSLLVEGATALTAEQREIAFAANANLTRTLRLLVSGQVAGLTDAQRELYLATAGTVTRTLDLLVTGQITGLTTAQREVALATTGAAARTLTLLVEGQVLGLNDAQKQIALAATGSASRTLSLLVTGQTTGLTDAQKEIALSSTASFTRTIALAVNSSSMTAAQRALLLENTAPFARALELATTITGGSATLRNALMTDISTIARTLELAATGGTLTAEQQQIINTAGGSISRRLNLLASDNTITPAQRDLIGVVNGEIRALTVKQKVETTETVAISRSIDDKLSGILGAINRGLLSLIAVSQGGFASVAQSVAQNKYVSPGNALQASGLMPSVVSSNETFVSTLYNAILRREADPSGLAFYSGQIASGALTRAQVFDLLLRSNESWTKGFSTVGLEAGGWVGNGVWNRDSVVAAYAGGGSIALAGGEYVMRAPMAARYADVLPAMNAGAWSNDNGSKAQLAELRAMRAEMEAMRRQLASLQGEAARGADAAEDTAATNRDLARSERLRRGAVGKVKGAA